MSEFRLPRLPRDVALIDLKTGFPTQQFQRWWQSVVTKIETQEGAQDDLLAALTAVEEAVVTVEAAVVVVEAAAADASADAAAAQAAADEALDGVIIVDERTTSARQFLDAY